MMLRNVTRRGMLLVLVAFVATAATGQEPTSGDAEFERIAERYWQVLQRRPRKGTAFDYWYRHYLKAGKLDALRRKVDQQIAAEPTGAQPHLLSGFLHERERKKAEAIRSYARAERLAPDDYYPAMCRGMLLMAQQRYRDAASALERALELEPPRRDRSEIVQAVVRCHLREGNRDAAQRACQEFITTATDDPHLLRRLAEVVTAEGDAETARDLWQQLIAQPQSPTMARVTGRMELAQLDAGQGQTEAAIRRLRQVLAQLKPDSWLARDVCRRIEGVFLQDEDHAGLVAFWKAQRAAHPHDLQSLRRLAQALRIAGRGREAMDIYREALQLAPRDGELRRAFVHMLVQTGALEEASRQCEAFLEHGGTDVEILRILGQLYLQVALDEEQAAAQERAIETWRRIAEMRPDAPSAALQAAEACRHAAFMPTALRRPEEPLRVSDANAPLVEAAEAFYREAVQRATEKDHHLAVPYLEHLGAFFHAIRQPERAIAAWQAIHAPPHDTAELFADAAHVYFKYEYFAEAEHAAQRAVAQDPQDFRTLELLIQARLNRKQFDAAFEVVSALAGAADTPVRQDQARRLHIQVCSAGNFTQREIERLEEATAGDGPAVEELWLLGLLYASARRLDEAAHVLKRAVELSAANARLIRDYAEVLQRQGKLQEATEQYERLVAIEPHRRITHYRSLVQVQLRQGQHDLARETANQLVRSAPDDGAAYLLRAEVARQSGNGDEQISWLRKAVGVMPQETRIRRQLAHALVARGDAEQAFDELWRCWDETSALPEQISLVVSMSDVLEKTGSHQVLLDRLRAARRDQPKAVDLCLAEVHRRAGELAQARRVLTALLAEDDRDVDVLRQLAALAAAEQDWQAAIDYQQQVVKLDAAWTNVLDWARYYSESKRDEWLAEARQRKRQLMRAWAQTFREYRGKTPNSEADAQALRQELIRLNWALNKYDEKEQLLDPESTYQKRNGGIWPQLRLEVEILELVTGGPATAVQVERRLAEAIHQASTTAEDALQRLCTKEFLRERNVEGGKQYESALPVDELLPVAIRDFGGRMLGGDIGLSDVELAKLEHIVGSVGD